MKKGAACPEHQRMVLSGQALPKYSMKKIAAFANLAQVWDLEATMTRGNDPS